MQDRYACQEYLSSKSIHILLSSLMWDMTTLRTKCRDQFLYGLRPLRDKTTNIPEIIQERDWLFHRDPRKCCSLATNKNANQLIFNNVFRKFLRKKRLFVWLSMTFYSNLAILIFSFTTFFLSLFWEKIDTTFEIVICHEK